MRAPQAWKIGSLNNPATGAETTAVPPANLTEQAAVTNCTLIIGAATSTSPATTGASGTCVGLNMVPAVAQKSRVPLDPVVVLFRYEQDFSASGASTSVRGMS